jgi:predicted N-formylglutamate amidohydrolase
MKLHPPIQLFLSCEHGGNQIPADYKPLFEGDKEVLYTHRGWDRGALSLYNLFEKELKPTFAISSETCRLMVDLNRSLHRRTLFSEWTKPLPREQKQRILDDYYFPYRHTFIDALKKSIDQHNRVLHLSVHSFTPVLNGVVRQTDIGILYHPGRPWEKAFAAQWKASLAKYLPQMRVRFNYPYLGKPDGHVAYHRKMYPDALYAGIELELNCKYAFDSAVYEGIVKAFADVLGVL